jgi:hypothetical protein
VLPRHGWVAGPIGSLTMPGTMFACVGRKPSPGMERLLSEVVRFISKSDLERARLIREARAIYESIFPSATPVSEPRSPKR